MILSVKGDVVTIKDANNAEQTFTVGADTVYKKTKGLTGVIHDKVEKGEIGRAHV